MVKPTIVHFSDWHTYWTELPPADLYICTGDMLRDYPERIFGDSGIPGQDKVLLEERFSEQRSIYYQGKELAALGNLRYLLGSPNAPVVVCRGNHDFVSLATLFDEGPIYEIGEQTTVFPDILGLKVGGFRGVNPISGRWSDELDEASLRSLVDKLPLDLDVLVTHCPPFGLLDAVPRAGGRPFRYGVAPLAGYIQRQTYGVGQLSLHCFGHVHESCGISWQGQTGPANEVCFSNASQGFSLLQWSEDHQRWESLQASFGANSNRRKLIDYAYCSA